MCVYTSSLPRALWAILFIFLHAINLDVCLYFPRNQISFGVFLSISVELLCFVGLNQDITGRLYSLLFSTDNTEYKGYPSHCITSN